MHYQWQYRFKCCHTYEIDSFGLHVLPLIGRKKLKDIMSIAKRNAEEMVWNKKSNDNDKLRADKSEETVEE